MTTSPFRNLTTTRPAEPDCELTVWAYLLIFAAVAFLWLVVLPGVMELVVR